MVQVFINLKAGKMSVKTNFTVIFQYELWIMRTGLIEWLGNFLFQILLVKTKSCEFLQSNLKKTDHFNCEKQLFYNNL